MAPSKTRARGCFRQLHLEFFLTETQRYRKQPTGSNLQANPGGRRRAVSVARGHRDLCVSICKQWYLRRDIGSVARGVAVVVAQAAARVRKKAGKTGKAACGVLSPRIVVRVFLVVRVVRGGWGGHHAAHVYAKNARLSVACDLVLPARCACGLRRREKT